MWQFLAGYVAGILTALAFAAWIVPAFKDREEER
jgi:hypothetical protein